jgi:hypothetical protein
MNSGVSPLRHRARTLSPDVVRTRINSGASPHHRFAPDFGGWNELECMVNCTPKVSHGKG